MGNLIALALLLLGIQTTVGNPPQDKKIAQGPKAMDEKKVRLEVEQTYRIFWQRRYQAHILGVDESIQEPFLRGSCLEWERWKENQLNLPPAIFAAYEYYLNNVQLKDWGSVRVFQTTFAGQPLYWVRTTTDGDDGWVEVFDEKGKSYGAGRTYIELIDWGTTPAVRASVDNRAFPPTLDRSKTLWKNPGHNP